MANPYSQYTGARVQPLPPGYLEAYGRVGEMYSEGIAGLGEGIGEGIAKYYENKEAEEQSAALGDLFQVKEKAPAAEQPPAPMRFEEVPQSEFPKGEPTGDVTARLASDLRSESDAILDEYKLITNKQGEGVPFDKLKYFEVIPDEFSRLKRSSPEWKKYVKEAGVFGDPSGPHFKLKPGPWNATVESEWSAEPLVWKPVGGEEQAAPPGMPLLPQGEPEPFAPPLPGAQAPAGIPKLPEAQPLAAPAAPADRFLPKKQVSVNERVAEWLVGQQLKGRKPNADTIARAEKAYQQESDNERQREMDAVAVKATELGMQKTQAEITKLMGSLKPGEFKVVDLGVHPQTGKPIPYGMVSDPKGNFHFFKMPDEAADTPASQEDADNYNAKLKEKKLPYQWVPNINEPGEFMLKSTLRPTDILQLVRELGEGIGEGIAPKPKKNGDEPLTLEDLREKKK